MKKSFLLSLFLCFFASIHAQWAVTPNGVLVDSITEKTYMVIQREGSAAELYNQTLKNAHRLFIRPDDVVSTIENEMISIRGYGETTTKYAGMTMYVRPLISVKIEFKDNRMRVSGNWISSLNGNAISRGAVETDPYTLFVKGSLKCFDKNGKIKNEKRYESYNSAVNQFINPILAVPKEEDNDW